MPNDQRERPDVRFAKAWLLDAAGKLSDFAHDEDVQARSQEMLDVRATVLDIANRCPLPSDTTNTVTIAHAAIEVYGEAQSLIQHAHAWAQGADITNEWIDAHSSEAAVALVERRREQAREMELSLYRSLVQLMFVPQTHDGPLRIERDSRVSFYWKHERSGYHGGLIYHASYEDSTDGRVQLPVGTWSVHT